jgi:hypothetical protein
MITQNDWVVQVAPENKAFFDALKGQKKTFALEDDGTRQMDGYVLSTEQHTHNMGKPQVQVQIRRQGW